MLVRKPKGWVRDLQLLSSGYLNFSKTPAGVYYAMRYSRLQNPDWDFLSRCELHQPIWDVEAGYLAEELDRRGDYRYLRKRLDDKKAKSKMTYKLKKADQRADIIAYLKTFEKPE